MSKSMAIVLIVCALVAALCAAATAITPTQAVQAVKDFEDNQNLQCRYTRGSKFPTGAHSWRAIHSVLVTVQANGSNYTRRYRVTDSAMVTGVDLNDADPDKNPNAALEEPITTAQGLSVAQQLAASLFADYASCDWTWQDRSVASDKYTYYAWQTMSNDALADRLLIATVSLTSGQVTHWLADDYTLPAAASATPSISPSAAVAAAVEDFEGLDGLTPSAQKLRYFGDLGLVYQIGYSFDPSQKPAGTPVTVYVDAQTGDLVWGNFLLGGAGRAESPIAPTAAQKAAKLVMDAFLAVVKAVASLF